MTTPIIEVTIAAPAPSIWPALRDPELIAQWHGWQTGDDTLADEINLIYLDGAEAVQAEYVLKLSGGDVFELIEVGGTTRLRITRAPYDPEWEWAAYYDDITAGWETFAQQLRFWLERHPGELRRTLFYSGDVYSGDVYSSDVYSSDTDPFVDATPGGGGSGDWFESEFQRGVVLDDLGPGLLIVAHKPVSGSRSVMVHLTTYGLDDGRFAQVKAVWDAWWAGASS